MRPLRSVELRWIKREGGRLVRRELLSCGHEHLAPSSPALRRRCADCSAEEVAPAAEPEVLAEVREELIRGVLCALCRDSVVPGSAVLRCPGCSTLIHPECRAEMPGLCPTLGCPTRTGEARGEVVRAPEEGIRVVLAPRRRSRFPRLVALSRVPRRALVASGEWLDDRNGLNALRLAFFLLVGCFSSAVVASFLWAFFPGPAATASVATFVLSGTGLTVLLLVQRVVRRRP